MKSKPKYYEYVNSYYGVNFIPRQRVIFTGEGMINGTHGTVTKGKSTGAYVWVVFDGRKHSVPVHPTDLQLIDDMSETFIREKQQRELLAARLAERKKECSDPMDYVIPHCRENDQ